MPLYRVTVYRTEYMYGTVEVKARSAKAAKKKVEEEGVDSDQFDCANADEYISSVEKLPASITTPLPRRRLAE